MGAFFVYIVKSAVCLAVFYLFYRLLLSRETFHRFNRIALLGILILSCAIPFVEVTMKEPMEVSQQLLTWEELLLMADLNRTATIEAAPVSAITWREVLLMVYLLGIVFFFLRNVWSLTRMLRLIKGSTLVRQENGITLITHQKKIAPFSWMKFVVISEKDLKENGEEILTHEYAHIRKRHSIDLLIADICIFFQWFNPASWLLKQELQNIHEFEADESVIAQGIDAKKYQLLLIKKAVGTRLYSMANSFNHSSLKKRITMMLSSKPTGKARVRAFVMVPAMALALIGLATPAVSAVINEVSAATPVEDLRYKISEKSDSTIRVTERNSDVVVTEKADAADAVPFIRTETAPNFPGGKDKLIAFINENISFPENAYTNGSLDMDAVVQLTIAKDGVVKDAHIVKSSGKTLDTEALRVARMLPKFHPGLNGGLPAESSYTLAFNYSINKQ